MSLVRGVVIGVVQKLDEQRRGEVLVDFPVETDEQTGIGSEWARVATLMAGDDRGSWFMPEAGDQVLVAFGNDDAVDPYVIGYVWSEPPGTAARPPQGAKFGQRRLKSKLGHTFTFDDTDADKVEILSKDGHVVTLDDAGSKVEVKAKSGHSITLDDTKIELKVGADKTVTVDGSQIELKVGGRRMAMTASAIEFF